MTTKDNYYQSAYISEDAPGQPKTRQVASGHVPEGEVILPLRARNIPSAENIPLVPLTMSEEKTCGTKEVGIAAVSSGIGGVVGYFAASQLCCPGASVVAHATVTIGAAICSTFFKPAAISCVNSCDDTRPVVLSN